MPAGGHLTGMPAAAAACTAVAHVRRTILPVECGVVITRFAPESGGLFAQAVETDGRKMFCRAVTAGYGTGGAIVPSAGEET